ncbi:MAG: hypothetical protein IT555_11555 [Acetobacteraceae bacterium]|nr:hypothetical protein [Acetobacteraceae bacterium]
MTPASWWRPTLQCITCAALAPWAMAEVADRLATGHAGLVDKDLSPHRDPWRLVLPTA